MKTITMTSKGQITIPIEFQRQLGLRPSDKLRVYIHPLDKSITLQKPLSIDEVATKLHALPKNIVKPILDPRSFYEVERTKEVMQHMADNL